MTVVMIILSASPVGASVKADRETHGLISQEVVPDATKILFGELNEETGDMTGSMMADGEEILGDGEKPSVFIGDVELNEEKTTASSEDSTSIRSGSAHLMYKSARTEDTVDKSCYAVLFLCDDFEFEGEGHEFGESSRAGIYCDGKLIIVLGYEDALDDNDIKITTLDNSGDNYGIYTTNSLEIYNYVYTENEVESRAEDTSLTVICGASENGKSVGIGANKCTYCINTDRFTLETGGTVWFNNTSSSGAEISDDVSVTVNSGNANESYGILTKSGFNPKWKKLSVCSGDAEDVTCGIWGSFPPNIDDIRITVGTNTAEGGLAFGVYTTKGVYVYEGSSIVIRPSGESGKTQKFYGVYAGTVNLEGGELSIWQGSAIGVSVGIYATKDSMVTQSGSVLNIVGSAGSGESCGIYSETPIRLKDGSIVRIKGGNTVDNEASSKCIYVAYDGDNPVTLPENNKGITIVRAAGGKGIVNKAGEEIFAGDDPVALDESATYLKVIGLEDSYEPGDNAPDVSSVSVKMVDANGNDKVIEGASIKYSGFTGSMRNDSKEIDTFGTRVAWACFSMTWETALADIDPETLLVWEYPDFGDPIQLTVVDGGPVDKPGTVWKAYIYKQYVVGDVPAHSLKFKDLRNTGTLPLWARSPIEFYDGEPLYDILTFAGGTTAMDDMTNLKYTEAGNQYRAVYYSGDSQEPIGDLSFAGDTKYYADTLINVGWSEMRRVEAVPVKLAPPAPGMSFNEWYALYEETEFALSYSDKKFGYSRFLYDDFGDEEPSGKPRPATVFEKDKKYVVNVYVEPDEDHYIDDEDLPVTAINGEIVQLNKDERLGYYFVYEFVPEVGAGTYDLTLDYNYPDGESLTHTITGIPASDGYGDSLYLIDDDDRLSLYDALFFGDMTYDQFLGYRAEFDALSEDKRQEYLDSHCVMPDSTRGKFFANDLVFEWDEAIPYVNVFISDKPDYTDAQDLMDTQEDIEYLQITENMTLYVPYKTQIEELTICSGDKGCNHDKMYCATAERIEDDKDPDSIFCRYQQVWNRGSNSYDLDYLVDGMRVEMGGYNRYYTDWDDRSKFTYDDNNERKIVAGDKLYYHINLIDPGVKLASCDPELDNRPCELDSMAPNDLFVKYIGPDTKVIFNQQECPTAVYKVPENADKTSSYYDYAKSLEGTIETWIPVTVEHEYTGEGTVTETNVVEAGCDTWGSYDENRSFFCYECGQEVNETLHRIVPPHGHIWGEWELKEEPTDDTEGYYERVCQNDPEHVERRIIPANGEYPEHEHVMVRHPYKDATETEDGNIEYWECVLCWNLFSDANGTSPIAVEDTVIPAKGTGPEAHVHTLKKHDAKPATETEDGNIEYWECTDPECGKLFADEAGNTEIHISDTIIPAGKTEPEHTVHTLIKHDAKPATETEAGNIEYWECTVCHKYFADEDAKREIGMENIIIPAGKTEPEPHPAPGELKLTHHAAVAPTMEKDGMAEYWEDTETGKLYADAEGKNEVKDKTSLIIPISSVYNVTNVKIDGCSISMNVVMVKSVSYNGTKHVTKLSKQGKGTTADVDILIKGNFDKIADVAVKDKNNKTVPVKAEKKPMVTLQLKLKKSVSKEDKKKLKSDIKTINQYLKAHPFNYEISRTDLGSATKIEAKSNKTKTKVSGLTVTLNGQTVKLSKKDFKVTDINDGVATIEGEGNFTGKVMVKL